MYSLFPELLDFSMLGVALLRIAAGLTFVLLSVRLLTALRHIQSTTHVLFIGGVYGIAQLAVGSLLTIGLYTQGAAIAGLLLTLLASGGHMGRKSTVSEQHTSTLLFVICLSLLFLGAGAFAFDLPI